MNGQRHASAALPSSTHWLGGWMGPRAGLDDVEKRKLLLLPGLELRLLGRPTRGQSLYRWLRFVFNISNRAGVRENSKN
jgi:hypothetical protein